MYLVDLIFGVLLAVTETFLLIFLGYILKKLEILDASKRKVFSDVSDHIVLSYLDSDLGKSDVSSTFLFQNCKYYFT